MDDRIYWRSELPGLFGRSDETIRRWIKDKRLPEPDVDLSNRTRGWSRATLHAHGIKLPASASQSISHAVSSVDC